MMRLFRSVILLSLLEGETGIGTNPPKGGGLLIVASFEDLGLSSSKVNFEALFLGARLCRGE